MLGGQEDAYSGPPRRDCPTGSGQEQCGDPECHPANPAPRPQTLGCACPPQQQVRPLTEKPWPLGSTSSSPTPGAVWTAHPSGVRCGPGDRGCLPPGAAIWAMLCWEPGPRANGLSRGRRLGRTPPIDLRRNATSLAGVTRPSPASPFRIRGATNGVGVPMARRTLQRAQGAFGAFGWPGNSCLGSSTVETTDRRHPSHGRSRSPG
jgi:hypothetical protein